MPSPVDLPNKGIEPGSPAFKVDSLPTEPSGKPLCDPMGYTVDGILQARILEWVAFLFSRGSSQTREQLLLTIWMLLCKDL